MNLGARRSRVLGVIWILAGLGLLGGAVVLWFDRQTVSVWEVPLALVTIVIGLYLWSQRVTVDRHGITLSSMLGSQRILWAGIASVDMQATWWRPSMTIHRKGDGQTTPIRTTSGLTAGQREVLYDLLLELAREHGFEVSRPGMPEAGAVMPATAAAAAAGFETPPGAGATDGDATDGESPSEGVIDEDAVDADVTDSDVADIEETGAHEADETDETGAHEADEGGVDQAVGEEHSTSDAVIDDQDAPSDPDATVAMDPVSVTPPSDDDMTEEVVVLDEASVPDEGSGADPATEPAAPVAVGEPREEQ